MVAVISTFLGAAAIKMAVLSAVQLLWLNLIMDSLGSLALATEPPNENLLDKKPHTKNDYIISRKMVKHIVGVASFQVFIILVVVFKGESLLPEYNPDGKDYIFFNELNKNCEPIYLIDSQTN